MKVALESSPHAAALDLCLATKTRISWQDGSDLALG